MSISAFTGPLISFGQGQFADYNPQIGPSLFYAGAAILDPRAQFTYNPGRANPTCGFLGSADIATLNIAPPALSQTALSTAAATTGSTPIALVAASAKATAVAANISITNASTGVAVTGLVALDAFASVSGYICNGTSGVAGNLLIVTTSTVSLPLIIGMTLAPTGGAACVITGYGPSVGASVTGVGFTGVYTVSGAAQAVGTSGSPVTITGALGASTGDAVTSSRLPFGSSGSVQLWNPQALSARAVSITPVSGTPTGNITFTVAGYDIYGFPMSEAISLTSGSTQGTAVNGKKAFKYIASITPSVTDTVTYSAGTTNIFGLPLRSDNFGDVLVKYAAALNPVVITSATGYVAADTTLASTTTGDVRGTYTNTPSIGANRFVVQQSPYPYNIGSSSGLFGVSQV